MLGCGRDCRGKAVDDRMMENPLGGRLMVRLQTLDLRIGVRVPASQPLLPKELLLLTTQIVALTWRGEFGVGSVWT